MKFLKVCISTLICISLVADIIAQTKAIKELRIGDTMPDVEIKNVINYSKSTIRISDFNNKLVILDFWATWCSPCVASFPKLDSLQKKFEGKIQIVPVTQEEKSKVEKFLSRMAELKRILLFSVTNDKMLKEYFRHSYIPHYVWINSDKKIIAITEEKDVNEKNIQIVLNGGSLKTTLKNDKPFSLQKINGGALLTTPSFYVKADNKNQVIPMNDSAMMMYSLLTGYIEGIFSGASFRDNEISVSNATISSLYKIALNGNGVGMLGANRIIIDIPDSTLYEIVSGTSKHPNAPILKGLEAANWKRKYAYSYELKVGSLLAPKQFDIMVEDLNRYFGALYGIEGVMQNTNVKYLALVRTGAEDKLASRGGKPSVESDRSYHLKITNNVLSEFILALVLPLQKQPFIIDETGYKGAVDLELNCSLSDLAEVNKALLKYELKLVEKQKMLNVAVVRMKR